MESKSSQSKTDVSLEQRFGILHVWRPQDVAAAGGRPEKARQIPNLGLNVRQRFHSGPTFFVQYSSDFRYSHL